MRTRFADRIEKHLEHGGEPGVADEAAPTDIRPLPDAGPPARGPRQGISEPQMRSPDSGVSSGVSSRPKTAGRHGKWQNEPRGGSTRTTSQTRVSRDFPGRPWP